MLLRLSIRDFVIVDRLDLDFEAGFGALTGETGAGKSILVDALALALGERADAGVVRVGKERADISAEFDVDAEAARWLDENAFDKETCLLRRVVDAGGRSRAWINGSAATAGQLRELGERLADIHGQHAHHSLLRADAQRELLDAHAGASDLAREVAARYAAWRAAHAALDAASRGVESSARERDLLAWQIKEIEGLHFAVGEWRDTEAEQRRLGHAAALLEASAQALATLDDGDSATLPALRHAQVRLGEMTGIDAGLGEAATLFDGAVIQLEEAAMALRRYRDRLDIDPQRLAELDARIDAVTQAARKHRCAPEELPARLDGLRERHEALRLAADPTALAEREAAARDAYAAAARELTQLRSRAAKALSKAVTGGMQDLALAGGRFEIAIERNPAGSGHGDEDIEFRVAANAGQELRPLAKVASGGELSRIGLVLQVIASRAATAGTLIFDEVDVGIGGRVAESVGRLLATLGEDRQVLCVTHLPQVAARAAWQWSIAKREEAGTTVTAVAMLDSEGRIGEIARMLGGEVITDTTRRHAREMLGRDG